MELNELNMRKLVAKSVIDFIENLEDEPGKEDALLHYKAELATIEKLIEEYKEEKNNKPKDVVVGLKTAKTTARRS